MEIVLHSPSSLRLRLFHFRLSVLMRQLPNLIKATVKSNGSGVWRMWLPECRTTTITHVVASSEPTMWTFLSCGAIAAVSRWLTYRESIWILVFPNFFFEFDTYIQKTDRADLCIDIYLNIWSRNFYNVNCLPFWSEWREAGWRCLCRPDVAWTASGYPKDILLVIRHLILKPSCKQ